MDALDAIGAAQDELALIVRRLLLATHGLAVHCRFVPIPVIA
jgi:hypothetical protein